MEGARRGWKTGPISSSSLPWNAVSSPPSLKSWACRSAGGDSVWEDQVARPRQLIRAEGRIHVFRVTKCLRGGPRVYSPWENMRWSDSQGRVALGRRGDESLLPQHCRHCIRSVRAGRWGEGRNNGVQDSERSRWSTSNWQASSTLRSCSNVMLQNWGQSQSQSVQVKCTSVWRREGGKSKFNMI